MSMRLFPAQPMTPYAWRDAAEVFLVDLTIPGGEMIGGALAGPGARMDGAHMGGAHFGDVITLGDVVIPTERRRWATSDYAMPIDDATPRQYDGRVSDPGSFERSIALSPIDSPEIKTNGGTVTLVNTDGRLDDLFDELEVRGCPVEIRLGRAGALRASFDFLAKLYVTGWDISLADATLTLGDVTPAFDQNIAFTTYPGTGGLNGSADLEGQMRPLVFGQVYNMAPILIDPVRQIYQCHDGFVQSIDAVRDGGMPLDLDGNVGTYALLESRSVPPGQYATCRAVSCFKLGSIPTFRVTADVIGRAGSGGSIGAIDMAKVLANEVETITGAGAGVVPVDVDNAAFTALAATDRNDVIGWVVSEPTTYRTLMNILLGPAVCFWGASRTGRITVRAFEPPDPGGAVVASYDANDVLDVDRITMPQGYETGHRSRTVNYARNWSPMDGSEVAAAAPMKWGLRREWASYTAPATVPMRAAITPDPSDSALRTAGAATRSANRMQALHGQPRRMYLMTSRLTAGEVIPDLGDQVRVTYDRLSLDGGRVLRVVGVQEEYAEGTVALTLWG